MTSDLLLPGWHEKIATVMATSQAFPFAPPLSQPYLADRVHLVLDQAGAHDMVQAALESPVSCIGIDTEYRFAEDRLIRLRGGKVTWHDIRSIRPFCIAFAIASSGRMLRFVVDLRINDLLPMVQEVLDLPVPFTSHHGKSELFTVWSLGLREPRILWDTLLAERALRLGGCPLRRPAGRDLPGIELPHLCDMIRACSHSCRCLYTGEENRHGRVYRVL